MKRILSTLLAVVSVFGAWVMTATYADARPFHHHRTRVGVYIGAPVVVSPWHPRPYYYDPYYPYYYPRIIVQEPPVVYTEQAQPAAPMAPPPATAPQAQPQQQYWYFCQDTQTYYPHVQTCATPWQRVIPHAPQ